MKRFTLNLADTPENRAAFKGVVAYDPTLSSFNGVLIVELWTNMATSKVTEEVFKRKLLPALSYISYNHCTKSIKGKLSPLAIYLDNTGTTV